MERTPKIQELRKKAMALPLLPGVYIMKDAQNDIIYIGKAKALKNRVSQYFGSDTNHPEKVRQIFEYSLHDNTISRFRRMMTLEQFRSPELAALYSRRYVERVLAYHAGIFRALIAAGEITAEDPNALAMLYVSPVLTLIGICDRQPEREHECLDQLKRHVSLFFRMVHAKEA